MPFTLPPLPYDFGALEPYIDAKTMEIHHDGHHATYVANLNKALENYPDLASASLEALITSLDTMPTQIRTAVRNNGGGHLNHSFFWPLMKKNGGGEPNGPVAAALKKQFGSFAAFQDQFNTAAKGVFGSGWAWLSIDTQGNLAVTATPNQDSPLNQGLTPILGLDVWEHAYYLKYQNKRASYIDAWWHVINWEKVEEHYDAVTK